MIYVPEIGINLFSIAAVTNDGMKVEFEGHGMVIRRAGTQIFTGERVD